MLNEKQLIKKCLEHDSKAQKELYERFAYKMFGVCLRYAKDRMQAQDILQEGFIKVFKNLHTFRFEGSLEGWIRHTMVNTAINFYRKDILHAEFAFENIAEEEFVNPHTADDIISDLSKEELLNMINSLPDGYRVIFNLYVIEGYTHKEIAEMLGISENTSKSQLSRARKILQEKLKKIKIYV